MSADDSLPKIRFATFCKMVLTNQQTGKDLSLIGVMSHLTLHIEGTGDMPDLVDFVLQDISLFASLDAPQKKEDVTITTQVRSADLANFRMEPTEQLVRFSEPQFEETGTLTIRMDGLRIPIPVKEGRHSIEAKWSVGPIVIGRLTLPLTVKIVKPE